MLRINILCLVVVGVHMVFTSNASPSKVNLNEISGPAKNFTEGERQSGDDLLYHGEVIVAASKWYLYDYYTFNYPNSTSVRNGVNITYIEVTDLAPDDNGAYGMITSGGPGSDSVTIRFVSDFGGEINSTVDIYGTDS